MACPGLTGRPLVHGDDLAAHLTALGQAAPPRQAHVLPAERGDDGTNDLYVSDILRTNEMQVWFLAEHLENPAAALPRGSR